MRPFIPVNVAFPRPPRLVLFFRLIIDISGAVVAVAAVAVVVSRLLRLLCSGLGITSAS